MPERSRSHELESESRVAFENALPSRLVFRPIAQPDYGIDGEVEEFGEEGKATGLRFGVQLKATDEKQLSQALKVRIPLETVAYYRNQPTPILMVRYLADRDEIYVRWTHEFDPYYEHQGDTHITFHWNEENLWSEETAERVLAEARQFYAARRARLELPIKLRLEVPKDGAHQLSSSELALAVQTAVARKPELFSLAAAGGANDLTLTATEDAFGASFAGGIHTMTMHLESEYEPGDSGEVLAGDLLAAAAFVLARAGHASLASRAAIEYLPGSLLSPQPGVALEIASAMAYADRASDALELAEALDRDESDDVVAAGFLVLVGVLSRGHALSEPELVRVEEALQRRINRRLEDGANSAAAGECIGLAHHHMSREHFADAIEQFERALQLEPDYEQRGYYWEEIGGAYFLDNQPKRAAEAYLRAVELGSEDLHLRARYADALLHSGQYKAAFDEFDGIETDDIPLSAWAYVKSHAIAFLINETGVEEQERQVDRGVKAAAQMSEEVGRSERKKLKREIFDFDAASPLGWFNCGRDFLDRNKENKAKSAYLLAAVMREGDAEAWVNVALLSLNTDDGDLFETSVITGARLNRETYLGEFASQLRASGEDTATRESVLDLVNQVIEAHGGMGSSPRQGFTVRHTRPGGSTESIHVPPLA